MQISSAPVPIAFAPRYGAEPDAPSEPDVIAVGATSTATRPGPAPEASGVATLAPAIAPAPAPRPEKSGAEADRETGGRRAAPSLPPPAPPLSGGLSVMASSAAPAEGADVGTASGPQVQSSREAAARTSQNAEPSPFGPDREAGQSPRGAEPGTANRAEVKPAPGFLAYLANPGSVPTPSGSTVDARF